MAYYIAHVRTKVTSRTTYFRQDSKRSTYIPAPHTAVALARLLDLKFSEVWSVLEGPGSMLLGML